MLDPVVNFGKVTVSTGYSDTDTSIVLTSGGGSVLPDPDTDGYFTLVRWNVTDYAHPADDPSVEIVRVTAKSSDTLTVTRAQKGTAATTKNTGGKTYKMISAVTKKMIDDIDCRYTLNHDESPENFFYRGDAEAGSSESSAVWRIRKVFLHNDGENIEVVFADGDTEFDNIWDNRASLFYPTEHLEEYETIVISENVSISTS